MSERIRLVKLKWKPFNTTILLFYEMVSLRTEERDKLYSRVDNAKSENKLKEILIIIEDLNEKKE